MFRITPQPTSRHRITRCLLALVCMAVLVPEFLALPILCVSGAGPLSSLTAIPLSEENDSEKEKEEQKDDSKEDSSKELSTARSQRCTLAKIRHSQGRIPLPQKIYATSAITILPNSTNHLSAGSGLRQRC